MWSVSTQISVIANPSNNMEFFILVEFNPIIDLILISQDPLSYMIFFFATADVLKKK